MQCRGSSSEPYAKNLKDSLGFAVTVTPARFAQQIELLAGSGSSRQVPMNHLKGLIVIEYNIRML
jgi:hypothetical protein